MLPLPLPLPPGGQSVHGGA